MDKKEKNFLYRYRSINENNLSALLEDDLYASKPVTFNDPYDVSFGYDLETLYGLVMKNRTLYSKYFYSIFKNILSTAKNQKEYEYFESQLEKDYFKGKYKNQILKQIERDVAKYLASIREKYAIISLSSVYDQEVMWAHYADNAKGFVLKYDIEDLINTKNLYLENTNNNYFYEKDNELFFELFPVEYTDYKYDATLLIFNYLKKINLKKNKNKRIFLSLFNVNKNIDSLDVFKKMFILKKDSWSYEKEYRIVVPFYDIDEWNYEQGIIKKHTSIGKCVPSAIYLGEYITKANKIILLYVAKTKNIDVYQMKTSLLNDKFGLHAIKISEEDIDKCLSEIRKE